MYYRSSDDTPVWDRGRTPARARFPYACDGLIAAIQRASVPGRSHVDDTFHEAEAVWFARHVAHEAKRLGLYRAPLDLDVLVQLDVDAGEPVRQFTPPKYDAAFRRLMDTIEDD